MRLRPLWLTGLATGVLLGLLMQAMSTLTGWPLDRVLFDLTVVPGLAPYNHPPAQWTVHLLTAIAVIYAYEYVYLRFAVRRMWTGALYGSLVCLIYLWIAPQVAPEISSRWQPFLFWWLCHAFYGGLMHFMTAPKKGNPS